MEETLQQVSLHLFVFFAFFLLLCLFVCLFVAVEVKDGGDLAASELLIDKHMNGLSSFW